MNIDVEQIRQSPRQFCTVEDIEKLSDHAMSLEMRLAECQAALRILGRALDVAHAHAESLADSPEEMRIVNEARLMELSSAEQLDNYAREYAERAIREAWEKVCARRTALHNAEITGG